MVVSRVYLHFPIGDVMFAVKVSKVRALTYWDTRFMNYAYLYSIEKRNKWSTIIDSTN